MNNSFPGIITHLRAERKLTQKRAAADLGVSQSLLSHYENGIRECSLDFLCRAADYYGVTTDFLLGRTECRCLITGEDMRFPYNNQEKERFLVFDSVNVKVPSRKDIFQSLNMLFDIIKATGCDKMEAEAALYMSIGVYRFYRAIYKNDDGYAGNIFSLPVGHAMSCTAATYIRLESRINTRMNGKYLNGAEEFGSFERVRTDVNYLMERYPKAARSLIGIIDTIENAISPRNDL